MTRHTPNAVPLGLRLFLAASSVCLLIYMCAGLATGYTYIPGKRGGFLLSGAPTLLIVLSTSALFLASLLTIVDHYDKRPNESTYLASRAYCLKAALYLFVAAPFLEAMHRLLLLYGLDIVPHVHGLAEHYTFYTPTLRELNRYVDPIASNTLLLMLLAVIPGGLGTLLDKYSSVSNRLVVALFSASMLAISLVVLANTAHDFFSGEVKFGRRYSKDVVRALEEPAKFNAVLLTHFALGGILFTGGAFALVAAAVTGSKRKRYWR